jgi:hypothetical protein
LDERSADAATSYSVIDEAEVERQRISQARRLECAPPHREPIACRDCEHARRRHLGCRQADRMDHEPMPHPVTSLGPNLNEWTEGFHGARLGSGEERARPLPCIGLRLIGWSTPALDQYGFGFFPPLPLSLSFAMLHLLSVHWSPAANEYARTHTPAARPHVPATRTNMAIDATAIQA